jgi:hypothetical protein
MFSNTKIIFITFGDGSADYREAAVRLKNQAESTGMFDELYVTNIDYIALNCGDELFKHKKLMNRSTRGFGYWIWKPMILKHLLSILPDDSVVFYADAGCEISKTGNKKLRLYIRRTLTGDAIFFKLPYAESMWSKRDLLDHPKLRIERPNSLPHYQATYFLLKNNDKMRQMISDWYEIASQENYRFLNDEPSSAVEYEDFKEHRHDQSILSCLIHAYKLDSHFFSYKLDPRYSNSAFQREFIYDLRNRTGVSVLEGYERKTGMIKSVRSLKSFLVKIKFRLLVLLVIKGFIKN